MRDVELYEQILGLGEPWKVRDVELSIDEERVDIHVEHPEGMKWQCPRCARELSCYDHSPERTWRHLDTCQLESICTPGFRGCSARSMAWCRWRFPGRRSVAGSRC